MTQMNARLEIASRKQAAAESNGCGMTDAHALELADRLIAEEARTRPPAADAPVPVLVFVWVPYSKDLYAQQQLPAERRSVLLMLPELKHEGVPASVVVGYLRYAAGDKDSPYFVTPGVYRGRQPTHWCDCLGDNFRAPLWYGTSQHGRDAVPAPENPQPDVTQRCPCSFAHPPHDECDGNPDAVFGAAKATAPAPDDLRAVAEELYVAGAAIEDMAKSVSLHSTYRGQANALLTALARARAIGLGGAK